MPQIAHLCGILGREATGPPLEAQGDLFSDIFRATVTIAEQTAPLEGFTFSLECEWLATEDLHADELHPIVEIHSVPGGNAK